MRRTKIVATLGPATTSQESIEAIVKAGVNVVRMNFSHGSSEEHKARADLVRQAAMKAGRSVAILGDLQGPKIRIERFKDGKIFLNAGDEFVLDANLGRDAGDQKQVGLTYKQLPREVVVDDELWLDDGRLVLKVINIQEDKIYTKAINSWELSDNKGINRRGGGLSAEALTEKDKKDIKLAAEIDVDFLAVSFPRNGDDLRLARRLMEEAGGEAAIVAKVERAESIIQPVLDDIIDASDVIMVARGDLGVEIGDANLPEAQKMLIKRSRGKDKAVITATQMMESMITNPIPTRAEVFDVANAVMDGTDAVMLSGESATGNNPALVIETMSKICEEAEHNAGVTTSSHRIGDEFQRSDEAVAMASMYIGNHMNVKAVASLTESGATARWMSRISSGLPIYALTPHKKTCRRVSIYRGVYPVHIDEPITDPMHANYMAVELLIERSQVKNGDLVIVTKGDLMGIDGGTNMLKIIRVGDHIID
ncbi:MAG: Pyruvate kinase (EC [uncultured Thiotrichaceae bacterium]|uniref:Pyruvate kinase n=1 Tax=uncultured Thiotrichaceae bacterium TaxID=298394 RepID=A0A6S6SPE5_9GAMM|nr:MAG: Pyruvate kinase (EC [uncultured Thiotrichaceae bacterium]